MAFYTFPEQTGFFAYDVSINPPSSSEDPFVFGFGCSACLDDPILTFLTEALETFSEEAIILFKQSPSGLFGFVGESGKLYDSEGNYFQSYNGGENFGISGHVFAAHHNYFYGENSTDYKLINTNCFKPTGAIDSFYIVNVPDEGYSMEIKGPADY